MKKQFQLFVNENEKYIIDLNENECVSIGVLSNSVLYKSKFVVLIKSIFENKTKYEIPSRIAIILKILSI